MDRVPEPELMTEEAQAQAYAEADFEEAHSMVVKLFGERFSGRAVAGVVIDLGCGPGDIACRFAEAYPDTIVHGVDGSEAMLAQAGGVLARYPMVGGRVEFISGLLPSCSLPLASYDVVISNSLLHHLPDPQILWSSIRQLARPGAPVFVMDLCRPSSPDVARQLVAHHCSEEPAILQRDFYNSLLAAYRVEEVEAQLEEAGLTGLSVSQVSDRHLVVAGPADWTSVTD